MVYYKLTFYFRRDLQMVEVTFQPRDEDVPEDLDLEDLPEAVWCRSLGRDSEDPPFRDPHGFIEHFVGSPLGRAVRAELGEPYAVECEGFGVI